MKSGAEKKGSRLLSVVNIRKGGGHRHIKKLPTEIFFTWTVRKDIKRNCTVKL